MRGKSTRGSLLRKRDFKPFERHLRRQGYFHIAGVDEAGRGCLAGPVFAAAVVLPPDFDHPRLDDSKRLKPDVREEIFPLLKKAALAWAVASVDQGRIDEINIHRASLQAMAEAVAALEPPPDFVLVDGQFRLPFNFPQRALVRADQLSRTVAAASILAKVSRDRWMRRAASDYPEFGFERHKGYGTRQHFAAIARRGLTPLHRRTFCLNGFSTSILGTR